MTDTSKILRLLNQYGVFSHTVAAHERDRVLAELASAIARRDDAPAPEPKDPVDEFNDAVSTLVQRLENGMVTKWIVVIDSFAGDGGRGLWCQSSRDQHAHEALGMLGFAETVVKAKIIREYEDDPG